jgi:serine/threonine-protein kinase RsbW
LRGAAVEPAREFDDRHLADLLVREFHDRPRAAFAYTQGLVTTAPIAEQYRAAAAFDGPRGHNVRDDQAWLGATSAVIGRMALHELKVEAQVSEIARLIDWVQSCCAEHRLADEAAFKMTLALEEAVMNVISHAFAGQPPPHLITVRLDITPERFAAEVIDNGHPFDPTTAPGPNLSLPVEQRDPGGLGIHLMRRMTDRVEYRRRNGENVLRMEKARR